MEREKVSTGGSKGKGTRGAKPFISHQEEATIVHIKAYCFKDMNISPKKIVKISGWSIPSLKLNIYRMCFLLLLIFLALGCLPRQ